ncbi:MAG TPA: hypothetical protein VI565_11385 [Burkholderiales bacterium]|nr:hypothetical protein [Burkholderiales bacterium]
MTAALRAALVVSATLPLAAHALELRHHNFGDGWIEPNATIRLQFDRAPRANEGRLAVFIGPMDASTLFRASSPGELSYAGTTLPLPSGEHEVIVYQVIGNAWNEIARLPLKVLTRGGFETGRMKPRLDLTGKSQVRERHTGSAPAPERPTYADLAGQGGFESEHRRGDFSVATGFNFVGSSYRNEALRFGEIGAEASKTDLSDYRVALGDNIMQFQFGHVNHGNNPLLINSMASRGAVLSRRFGTRMDLSFGALNGHSIVGTDNFFGLADADDRLHSAVLGVELIGDRPGALRVELSYLDASVRSAVNFNAGEIPDAEESRGTGMRVLGNAFDGRLRLDLAGARSTYRNPNDPLLAQGDTLVAVQPSTDRGRIFDAAFDLLRDYRALSANQPLTLTLNAHHELIDPLYKSLGAFFGADQDSTRVGLTTQLGTTQLQLLAGRTENNIDDVPTLLKTRTEDRGAILALPLASIFARDGAPATVWPQLNIAHQRNRQFALNNPDFANSGFQATHLPDQHNTTTQFAAGWTFERWGCAYTYNDSFQDNRQTGRETADFDNRGHQVSINVRVRETLNLSLALGRTRNYSVEQDLGSYSHNVNLGFDWQIGTRWTLNGTYSVTAADDSKNLASADGYAAQTQLARRFELAAPGGRKLPGQFFLRHALQDNDNRDNVFGLTTQGRSWNVNAGVSLSLF